MTNVFPFVCAIFAIVVTFFSYFFLSILMQVYLQYTSEYMKGPMYWHPDKMWPSCRFCAHRAVVATERLPSGY